MRCVGDERALAGERGGEPVEHVVERVGEHPHLVPGAAGLVDARLELARVDPRGDRSHPPQRSRDARADEVGGQQRGGERERAGKDEGARDAVLGAVHRLQGLADADPHAGRAADRDAPLEQAQVADVGEGHGRVPLVGMQHAEREAVLPILLGGRLVVVGGRQAEQLGLVGARARAGDDREQQRRAGAEGLSVDVTGGGDRQRVGRGPATGSGPVDELEVVSELARVARQLVVDLVAQFGARSAVDGHEDHGREQQHHDRDPGRQPPA